MVAPKCLNLCAFFHFFLYSIFQGGAKDWADAEAEADELLSTFHLSERTQHMGSELSGGMKRKVIVMISLLVAPHSIAKFTRWGFLLDSSRHLYNCLMHVCHVIPSFVIATNSSIPTTTF